MNKNDELWILRDCADKLGSDSYCGPWLQDQIPYIERDIRGDMFPQLGWAETRKMEQNAISLAKEQAARIVKDAEEQAALIRKNSEKYAASVRKALAHDLEKALLLIQ